MMSQSYHTCIYKHYWLLLSGVLLLLNINIVKAQSPVNCVPLNATPTAGQNYIITYTPRIPLTDTGSLGTKNTCEVMQSIAYFDGLGRPVQTVQVKGNPGANRDVIVTNAYDDLDREITKYLPYTTGTGTPGSYRSDALKGSNGYSNSAQLGFYQLVGQGYATMNTPSSSSLIEPSPLNRVMEQGAPGDAWQLSTSGVTGAGHTVKMDYGSNDATSLTNGTGYWAKLYGVSINPVTKARFLTEQTAYAPNQLSVSITKDENWVSANGKSGTIEEYMDVEGRTVLKRTFNGTQVLSTYYVYDAFGSLCFVLPPKAEPDNGGISQATLDNLCYQYQYDERMRMTGKKIPGSGWQYMVYNKLDKVVMTQDANQRNKTIQEWTFTKYDALGRVVMTGTWIDGNRPGTSTGDDSGRVWLQGYYNTTNEPKWETRDNTTVTGYNNQSTPGGTNYTFLSINYYDDYNIPGLPSQYNHAIENSTLTKGLQTVTKVNVLGTNDMLWTVNYYDDKGRITHTYAQHYLGGSAGLSANNYDHVSNAYNFFNAVINTTRQHYKNNVGTASLAVTIKDSLVYDHIGRKLQTWSKINNGTKILLNQIDYNEIGQEKTKHLHSENNGTSYLQNIAYTYNERGWMTQINDPSVLPTPDKLFSLKLNYNQTQYGALANYNGNISEQLYSAQNSINQHVTYGYDALNRLTGGISTMGFSETNITYDKMGNFISLTRGNQAYSTLNYAYENNNQSNRLSTVTGTGFATRNYGYDANGNATSDGMGNTINYNMLNLPQNIPGKNLSYVYAASGEKLRKIANGSVTEYVKGIQYKPNGILDFIQTEEGRAINNGGNYTYEYTLKDHLGNNRVTFDQTNGKVGEEDYYPFGLNVDRQLNAGNRYLYNGKEVQDELNGQIDYGARFYDPVIARWTTPDPLAEHARRWSVYNYCVNNPMRFIDPDGMVERDQNGNIIYNKADPKEKKENRTDIRQGSNGSTLTLVYEQGYIKTDKGNSVAVDKLISSKLVDSNGAELKLKESDIQNFQANCNGTTFADGQYVLDGGAAKTILNDEYTMIGSDSKSDSKDIGDHDVVAIEKNGVDIYHTATKQKDGKGYTQKDDIYRKKTNQTLDQVTDYNGNGQTGDGPVETANRNYYKKNEKQ